MPAPDVASLVAEYASRRGLRRLLKVPGAPSLIGVNLDRYLFITARAHAEPEEAKPGEAAVAKGVPATAAEPAVPDVAALQDDLEVLQDQIKTLTKGGGDSALIARLIQTDERIQSLMSAGDMAEAAAQLESVQPLADRAMAELPTREEAKPSPPVQAQAEEESASPEEPPEEGTASSGQAQEEEPVSAPQVQAEEPLSPPQAGAAEGRPLAFQRALTYAPVEIHLTRYDSIQVRDWESGDGREAATKGHPLLMRQVRDSESESALDDPRELGDRLGAFLGQNDLLSRLYEGNTSLRFEFSSERPELRGLLWELARLAPDFTLGLDPRHSFVRLVARAADRKAAPVRPPVRILLAYASPTERAPRDEYLDRLREALAGAESAGLVEVHILAHASRLGLNRALDAHYPHWVHLFAHSERDPREGSPVVLLEDEKSDADPLRALDLGTFLGMHDVLGLVLDTDPGQEAAYEVARHEGLQAVVSWQTGAGDRARSTFAEAFYRALLRTGQVDYAITEGRRAIAARTGNLAEAVSPVLYLDSSSEGVLFS
jgi:hypothetical protein